MEIEYTKMLNLLMKMVEANKGEKDISLKNFIYAEGLATKFSIHALTILHLSSKTKIEGLVYNVNFLDVESTNVLARSCFETYLVFNFLFRESKTEGRKEFRMLCWELDSLLNKQKYPEISDTASNILKAERVQIEDLKKRIKTHPQFAALDEKFRKSLEKDRWHDCWREGKTWKQLAKLAGFSVTFQGYYSYLSSYAHSNQGAIKSLRSSVGKDHGRTLSGTYKFMQCLIARFIYDYKVLFDKSQKEYDKERKMDGDVNKNPVFLSTENSIAQFGQGATISEIWYEISRKELKVKE